MNWAYSQHKFSNHSHLNKLFIKLTIIGKGPHFLLHTEFSGARRNITSKVFLYGRFDLEGLHQ